MNLKAIKKKLNENYEKVFTKLGMDYEIMSDNVYCTCPVHEGSDNKTAFSFSIQKGIWKCWTRDCQHEYSNDIFGLIQGALSKTEGKDVSFKEVLRWSCELLNVKHTYSQESKIQSEYEDEFVDLVKLINSQSKSENKVKPIDINCAINCPSEYFVSRGFNKKTMKYFGVGDCYDPCSMKERAVIPIHNETGKHIVGLIGRSVKEYKTPKFLFYPKGFDKRFYFYNYHRAIKKAIETSCLYIMEGQGDVWRMYEAGVSNAVSILGKTITTQQYEKLISLPITNLIILTDNDQAGRESKVQIKRQLGRMFRLTFPKLSQKDIGDMNTKDIKNNILAQLKGTY